MTHAIGSIVKYQNGGPAIYTGQVMANANGHLTVIDPTNAAAMELWNAGFAVGSYISITQVVGE